MAFITANGGYFKWLGSTATETTQVQFNYVSARFAIGALAEIDVTGTQSTEREYAKGMDSGRTIEIEAVMDSTVLTEANLKLWQGLCEVDRLEWWYTTGCVVAVAASETFCADLYDYSIDAELDGALKCTMTFRLTDGAGCPTS